jgi:hypothetical protein
MNLLVAPPGVAESSANELARISTGDELPTNVGFGRDEDSNVLYVTSGKSLYRITLPSEGYQLPTSSLKPRARTSLPRVGRLEPEVT